MEPGPRRRVKLLKQRELRGKGDYVGGNSDLSTPVYGAPGISERQHDKNGGGLGTQLGLLSLPAL